MNRFLSTLLAVLLLSGPAFSQAVQQSGTVTPGHIPSWVTSGVIKDAGSATSSSITEFGVTKNGGLPFCVNSANTGALNRLCLTSTTNSGAKLTVTDQGGATDGTLTIDINGNSVVLPAAPGGTILPTVLTTPAIADSAPTCFSGTDGTLKSCGGTPGTGTVTSIAAGTGIAASPDPITTSGTISLAPIASGNLLGNSSGGSAAPTVQTVGSGLSLAMDTLQIGTASVTNAMLANMATNTLKGRSTAGTGVPEDITVGTGLLLSGGTLSATATSSGMPGGYSNLVVTVTGNSTLTITARAVTAATAADAALVINSPSVSCDLSTSGLNGLDTGAEAANTWYAAYVISDGTNTGCLLSLSATTPTMPGSYTYRIRVGWVRNDGSSNLYRTIQKNQRAQYVVGTNPASALQMATGSNGNISTPTWVAVATGSYVPTTASRILGYIGLGNTGNTAVMVAPNNSYGAFNSNSNPPPVSINSSNNANTTPFDLVLESTNIYWASGTATGLVNVLGWQDNL